MKAPMLVLTICCVMGCVAERDGLDEMPGSNDDDLAPPPAAAPEQDIGGGPAVLGPAYTEVPLSPHGGDGGGYTGHVTPPAIIYAVRVSSGGYVDSISFAWYQPTRFDNLYQSGDAWGSTPSYGGPTGWNNGWWYCPGGQGVIGIRGSSGGYVDRIGVICGDVWNPDPYSPYNTYSPLWGGATGGWFDDRCGAGRLVDSFNVRSGGYVDNLQAICINAY
jgi:hypothetical protein